MASSREYDVYCDPRFTPQNAALNCFKESDTSAVLDWIDELSNLKLSLETNMKDQVAKNYKIFMRATTDVQLLEDDLKKLSTNVEELTKAVGGLSSLRLNRKMVDDDDDDGMGTGNHKDIDDAATTQTDSSIPQLPSWLMESANDVESMTIEHRYGEAVSLIMRSKSYISKISKELLSETDGTSNRKKNTSLSPIFASLTKDLMEQELALVDILRIELQTMKCTPIWGKAEQRRKLSCLVELGYSEVAAQAFASSQESCISRSLRSVQAIQSASVRADPMKLIEAVCNAVFPSLTDTCKEFLKIFEERVEGEESFRDDGNVQDETGGAVSHLVVWVIQQVRESVSRVIGTEIRTGIRERFAFLCQQARISSLIAVADQATSTSAGPDGSRPRANSGQGKTLSKHRSLISIHLQHLAPVSDGNTENSSRALGPFSFVRKCFDICISGVTPLDESGIVVSPVISQFLAGHVCSNLEEIIALMKPVIRDEILKDFPLSPSSFKPSSILPPKLDIDKPYVNMILTILSPSSMPVAAPKLEESKSSSVVEDDVIDLPAVSKASFSANPNRRIQRNPLFSSSNPVAAATSSTPSLNAVKPSVAVGVPSCYVWLCWMIRLTVSDFSILSSRSASLTKVNNNDWSVVEPAFCLVLIWMVQEYYKVIDEIVTSQSASLSFSSLQSLWQATRSTQRQLLPALSFLVLTNFQARILSNTQSGHSHSASISMLDRAMHLAESSYRSQTRGLAYSHSSNIETNIVQRPDFGNQKALCDELVSSVFAKIEKMMGDMNQSK